MLRTIQLASIPYTFWRFALIAFVSAIAFGDGRAKADLVTYDFAGSIVSTTQFNASLPADVHVGSSYTGTLTYEDSIPGGSPGTFNGQYYHLNAVRVLTVHIGSATYSLTNILGQYGGGTQQEVIVADNIPYTGGNLVDQFTAAGFSDDFSNASHNKFAELSLDLYDAALNPDGLTSNALAGINLDLAKFTTVHAISFVDSDTNTLTGADNSQLAFQGSITSLRLQAVPEPSSVLMLGSGVLGLLGYGWRRHRRSEPNLALQWTPATGRTSCGVVAHGSVSGSAELGR